MYCENCGKQIEDGSRFCRYCGRETDATEILTDTVGRAETTVIVSEDVEAKDKKKKSKRGVIVAITAVLVTALAVLIGFSIYNKPENRLARALALGQRYLLEENYEQAIVEFNRAIEIDPKNEEAYIGLAEAYVETDDLEKAVRILEKGAGKTDSEELQEMFEKYAGKLAQEESPETAAEVTEAEASKNAETEEPAVEEGTKETESTEQNPAGVRTKRYDNMDGSYDLYTYDGRGNLIKEEYYDADGSLSSYYLYTYDSRGNRIKWESYNADGSLYRYYLYTFDSRGNMTKEECYCQHGKLDFYNLYSYNSNGSRLKSEHYAYTSGPATEENNDVMHHDTWLDYYEFDFYDSDENVIKDEHYDADGSLEWYNLYTYDGNGICIKEENYNADGSLQQVWEWHEH